MEMENGFKTFFEETRRKGFEEGKLEDVLQLQKNLNISFDNAADLLGLTGEIRERIREML